MMDMKEMRRLVDQIKETVAFQKEQVAWLQADAERLSQMLTTQQDSLDLEQSMARHPCNPGRG